MAFKVCDSTGQRLAYVYFEEEPGRRSAAKLPSRRGGSRQTLPSSGRCCVEPKTTAAQRLRLGIVGKGDQGRKTGAALRAMPNVTGVLVAPILGSHRRNQLSIAVYATHQHGDPHSPPRPVIIVPLQTGKTESISRPLLFCGVNQWIGGAGRSATYRSRSSLKVRTHTVRMHDGGQYESSSSRGRYFGAFSGHSIGPMGVPRLRLRTLRLRLRGYGSTLRLRSSSLWTSHGRNDRHHRDARFGLRSATSGVRIL